MKTVLLVDDTEVIRVVVAAFLRRFECTVVEAANGRQGLEKARELRPDLILLDVEMPEMDGLEALGRLREDPTTRYIPVIMLTAQSAKEVVMRAARYGVAAYIVKPVNRQVFDREVGKVLAGAGPPAASEPPQLVTLVVDDSPRVADALRAPLATRGPVIVATTGMAALERFQQDRPRAVILDLSLPDMDGFDLLAAMRQMDDGTTRYLALTVRGETEPAERALEAGFAGVIEKPVRSAEVLEKVTAALGDVPDRACVEWAGDVPVLVVPAPDTPAFTRFAPGVGATVRAIVDDGADRLVIDLSAVQDLTAEASRVLLGLVDEVRTRGLRAALCVPAAMVASRVGEIDEARGLPCVPSRPEAIAALAPAAVTPPEPAPAEPEAAAMKS